MRDKSPEFRLDDGSVVAVIGAGPAGTFFAHFALGIAQKMGTRVRVLLIDGKDFERRGPPGCNMCAGVVSETLMAKIEDEGFSLPRGRVQDVIDGFVIRGPSGSIVLKPPKGSRVAGHTFFRGSGPRFGNPGPAISFDDFLLVEAQKRGAEVIRGWVREITLPPDHSGLVKLVCDIGEGTRVVEAGLAVGAFGLNTRMLKVVEGLGFGYQAPHTRRACQVELFLGRDVVRKILGNKVHLWSGLPGGLRYAAMTPKGEYITVSLIGRGDVTLEDLRKFMALPRVKEAMPKGWRFPAEFCHCAPRIGDTAARKPHTDRMVIIGDACASRYYKNGIESAFVTAKIAAQCTFFHGISDRSFKRYYMKPIERTIIRDNAYGHFLFHKHDLTARSELTWRVMTDLADPRRGTQVAYLLRTALWDIVTGSRPYRDIFFHLLNPRLLVAAALALPSALLRAGRQESPTEFRGAESPPVDSEIF
ncbi:MAG: hypothetical protein ACE5LG_05675 [Anaerolineae bacterium]